MRARNFADAEMFELHGLGGAIAQSDFGDKRALQYGEILVTNDRAQITTRSATSQRSSLPR